ncbi:MEAB protein [Pyrenophora seminiperda CCB06]|uniref:MEAB protein n=1 Tax=Pyrenophora seminiperda CCB06 TaxID=1302712 RepID=A0A3M7M623_9PLEO|nr:MEAB protein [Pyrenophora seminiperda CCB06]
MQRPNALFLSDIIKTPYTRYRYSTRRCGCPSQARLSDLSLWQSISTCLSAFVAASKTLGASVPLHLHRGVRWPHMGDSLVTDMTAPMGKAEAERDGSTSSIGSSPEPGLAETYTQEEPQQQKRKGGRKPIYATSEERKQRNRQAQAAFRERRTEYIKQLESTIKHHEDTLQNLQNSHRTAADECLMLRYKNSLLERILLEKGIDVQAELRAKTGSPHLGPTRAPVSAHTSPNQAPLQQRAMMNRQQQRRSLHGLPKLDGSNGLAMIQPDGPIQRSPLTQPTPASHLSSPAQSATRSPNFMPHGQSVSPNFGPMPSQQQQQQQQQQPLRPQPPRSNFTPIMGAQRPSLVTNQPSSNGLSTASTVGTSANNMTQSSGPSSFYQTQFTDHMSQLGKLTPFFFPYLEQEYEEQADSYDHDDPSDHSAGPGPFPQQNFPPSNNMPPPMPPSQNPPFASPTSLAPNEQIFNGMHNNNNNNHLYDPYDPMLDADPFGLSASMHFPTMYESR